MPNLDNLFILHEVGEEHIELLLLLELMVVKDVADFLQWQLDHWDATFVVFAGGGSELAVESNQVSLEQAGDRIFKCGVNLVHHDNPVSRQA